MHMIQGSYYQNKAERILLFLVDESIQRLCKPSKVH